MRHLRSGKQLSRTSEHRRALLRNLVTELFRHERIETTAAKAKEARSLAERLITFAKRGDLHARRQVDRYIMSREVTRKLFSTIAPWYEDRPGGYTRIIRTRARLGDGAEMAFLELVKSDEQLSRERKAREAVQEAKAEKKGKAKGKKPKAEDTPDEGEEKPKKKAKTRTKPAAGGGKGGKGKAAGGRKSTATKAPARVKKGDG